MNEFYQTFTASRCPPQPIDFTPDVRRALARSKISYSDAVKLYWMMEFVAEAPIGTQFVHVGPMDELLERLAPSLNEAPKTPAERARYLVEEYEAAELEAMFDQAGILSSR